MQTDVTVRMYRPFLGDCFLLSATTGDTTKHMLIDCGILLGGHDDKAVMQAVAQDLAERTGGRLDVVVCTHEHWDHLSGFGQAEDIFSTLEFGEVWLPWTSNPDDRDAAKLAATRDKTIEVLTKLGDSPHLGAGAEPFRTALADVLATNALGAAGVPKKNDIVKWLRGRGSVRYLQPGQVLAPDCLPGLRCYTLGPPTDPRLLHKMDPTAGAPETYLANGQVGLWSAVLGAADSAAGSPASGWDEARALSLPFASHRALPLNGQPSFLTQHYDSPDEAWRRIDTDWLAAAGQLAISVENFVNNSSLALALERVEDRRVLLFPGDAQVGNWLSWDTHTWTVDQQPVTAADLLARTVFYKVGHHGSHNATLCERGLERMTSPELVAFIPVDKQRIAGKQGWQMPWAKLLARLVVRTRGRVIQGDDGVPQTRPAECGEGDWTAFVGRLDTADARSIAYTLPT